MCEEWRGSFVAFYAYMGPCPDGYSIDRIDNDGDYEPGNCRWATQRQQQRNRRDNVRISYLGETLTLTEWADRCGVTGPTMAYRLRAGWPLDKALTTMNTQPHKKAKHKA